MNYKINLIICVAVLFSTLGCNEGFNVEDIDSAEKRRAPKVEKVNAIGAEVYTGPVPDPCKQVCLVAGQHMYTGTVDVAKVSEGLVITYNVTEPNIYLEEVHLDIFKSADDFKNDKKISNGGAIPGKFEYKISWDANEKITSHSILILNSYITEVIGADPDCLFIASHAALSNGETAWGGICDNSADSINLNEALQFPGANWSVYFEFCYEECTDNVDFTYAWEDLQNSGNDADYNDLVIQSNVIKSASEVKIKFFASARGAAFDHQFKFKIPKEGIIDVFGAFDVDKSNPDYIIVTVWESTQAELPGEGYAGHPYAANTVREDDTCTPNSERTVTIVIDDATFRLNILKPYEPFITVFGWTGPSYDLYIWEISNRDTWLDASGKEFPNGIIIPMDWNWPYEAEIITNGYPDFNSIDSWNPLWADTEIDSETFSCN